MSRQIEDAASRNFSIKMIEVLVKSISRDWQADKLLPTKYLMNNPRQGEMYVVVQLNNGEILNIEFQSTAPTEDDLLRFLEYTLVLTREYKCQVHTLII